MSFENSSMGQNFSEKIGESQSEKINEIFKQLKQDDRAFFESGVTA